MSGEAPIRIAINGFGRIGRSVFRIVADREDVDVVGINDIAEDSALAYLLQRDSVMGTFEHEVRVEHGTLTAARQNVRISKERDPANLPWSELGVDVVVEATGRFRDRANLQRHIDAGAKKVLLTVPPKDEVDAMIVLGVNDDELASDHQIVSNASCTTNCLAPVAKVLDDAFGISRGLMTTVHAYTNDQKLADWFHADMRRSRAAGENTIPTTTGAARAVGKVLPNLAGKLDGMAIRVPVPNGSIVDLVACLEKDVADAAAVGAAFRDAASGPLEGILQYSEEPIVSSDIVGNPHSAIFDAPLTQRVGSRMVKVSAWYDNEWGYSNRVVELAMRMG